MSTGKYLPVILLICFLLLAGCTPGGALSNANQVATLVAATLSPQPNLVGIPPEETDSFFVDETTCQAGEWKITPTNVYQHSLGEGWKLLIVEFAVANESALWGVLSIEPANGGAYVSTEDSYIYEAIFDVYNFQNIPEAQNSPYSGENVYNATFNENLGRGVDTTYYSSPPLIPPGFRVSNNILGRHRFSLMFQVAENQDTFLVHLTRIGINCIRPNGEEHYESKGEVVLDLQNDVETLAFPTLGSIEQFSDLPSVFEIPGKGTVQYQGVERTTWDEFRDLVLMGFKFTSNSGYEVEGHLRANIIGSDGIMLGPGCGEYYDQSVVMYQQTDCSEGDRWFDVGYFGAGPSQTYDFEMGFLIWKGTTELKLVWLGDESQSTNDWQIFQLFSD